MTKVVVLNEALLKALEDDTIKIVKNYNGSVVINELDAIYLIPEVEHESEDWQSYKDEGLEIGAPRPKKPRT